MNVGDPLFKGNVVNLRVTNPLHIGDGSPKASEGDIATSFADALKNAVNKVNDLQVDSEELNQKMIYEPESVDVHSVMIAAQKAEIALTFTKAIRDEAIRTYRELMNLR